MIDLFAKWPAGWSRQGRSTLAIALGVVLLMLVLSFIDVPLAHLPEPIGSSAEQFAEGSRTTVMLTLVSGIFGIKICKISSRFLVWMNLAKRIKLPSIERER